jgi:glycosyltransferase involved in cell wall biosynthesis
MPEILGEGAVYFDPEDLKSIQNSIEKVLDNPKKRKEIVAKGRKRLSLYSWRNAAEETLRVYEKVLQ